MEQLQQLQQQQQSTPAIARRSSTTENQLYHSTRHKSNGGNSQWYIDMPRNAYLEALPPQSSSGKHFFKFEI